MCSWKLAAERCLEFSRGAIYSTALAVLTLEVYYRFTREGKGSPASVSGKTGEVQDERGKH